MAIQAQFPYSGSQEWLEYGCGAINHFNVQKPKQQLQQQQQQQWNIQQLQNQFQRNQNLFFDNNLLASSPLKNTYNSNHHLLMGAVASYDEKQRQEIDYYIRLQVWPITVLLALAFIFFFYFLILASSSCFIYLFLKFFRMRDLDCYSKSKKGSNLHCR